MLSPYLTIEEAIQYLRMDHLKAPRERIGRMVREGKLKPFRRGRVYLFTREQIDKDLGGGV